MKYQYWFMDTVLDDECKNLYFFAANIRGFFKWNLISNTVQLIDNMNRYPFHNEMYMNGILKNRRVYFPPRMAEQMAVFDLNSNKLSMYDLYDENTAEKIQFHPSLEGHQIIDGGDEFIFIMYRNAPCCVVWDCKKNRADYIFPEENVEEKIILAKDFTHIGSHYYFASVISNLVVELDIKKKTLDIYKDLLGKEFRYSSIASVDNKVCLITLDATNLIFWEPEKNTVEIKQGVFKGGDYGHNYGLISKNKKIYIIPLLDNVGDMEKMAVFDTVTEEFTIKSIFQFYKGYKKWRIFSIDEKQGFLFCKTGAPGYFDLYGLKNAIFVCLDLNNECVEPFTLPLPDGWNEETLNHTVIKCQLERYNEKSNDIFLYESREINIEKFLEIVKRVDSWKFDSECPETATAGENIYSILQVQR